MDRSPHAIGRFEDEVHTCWRADIGHADSASQNLRAGRLLLERIRELDELRADFGFETTLAGRSYVKLLNDYSKGIKSFLDLYRPIVDSWWLFSASILPPVMIAAEEDGVFSMIDATMDQQFVAHVGKLK